MRERGSKSQRCQSSEQHLEFFRRGTNDFLSLLVTMDETCLYHYDPETKQQSMERRIAAHPAPNFPSVKICWKSSRLHFLGLGRHPHHWLLSKGSNYQRGVLLISSGANKGHSEGKTKREPLQGSLFRAWHLPVSPGTCHTEETGLSGFLISWSPNLFSVSFPTCLIYIYVYRNVYSSLSAW